MKTTPVRKTEKADRMTANLKEREEVGGGRRQSFLLP